MEQKEELKVQWMKGVDLRLILQKLIAQVSIDPIY